MDGYECRGDTKSQRKEEANEENGGEEENLRKVDERLLEEKA